MRTLLRAAVAVAALLAMPLAALAADKGGPKVIDEIARPVAKAPSWTGCYIGLLGSYDMHSTQLEGLVTFDNNDLGYGVGLGCDYQVPTTTIVIGVMGDWMKSNTGNSFAGMTDEVSNGVDSTWSVLGRAGILFSPTTLVYGGVGYTKLDGGLKWAESEVASGKLDNGFTVAAGVETYVLKNVTLKAEYRWIDLGSKMIGGEMPVESHMSQVRFGLNVRF